MMYKSLEDADAVIGDDHSGRMGGTARNIIQIVIDVCLFFTVSVPVLLVGHILGPFQRGFFCDDETIRKPFLGDTVSASNLFIFTLLFPIVTIVCVEFIYLRTGVESYVRASCKSGAKLVGVFLYGFLVTLLLTEVAKLTVGRLRPHFIDTCRPNFTMINCSLGYITDFNCTNEDLQQVEDARKSFPSGHASLSAFTGMFLVYYFHYRVITSLSVMLKFVLQAVAVGAAMFCGLSRVMNNRHHPQDVLAGMLLGVVVAVWTFVAVGNRCMEVRRSSQSSKFPEYGYPHQRSIQREIRDERQYGNDRSHAYDHD